MPHYKTAFPSKFLSAADIERPYDATIENVDFDEVGTDDKPERKLVATFKDEGCRPIVLNKTRCEVLEELAGTPDYDLWAGTRVRISQGTTRYAGKRVPCIDFSKPNAPARPASPAQRVVPKRATVPPPEPDTPMPTLDDDDKVAF